MKVVISPYFKDNESRLRKIISDFQKAGKTIYGGSRNTIKIFPLEGITLNVKAFKVPHFINKIAYRHIRKSKAERSYLYANKLLEKGIGTPRPVAYFENKTPLTFLDSYYICEHLQCDFTFRDLVDNQDRVPQWESLLRQFTQFTYAMHEAGVEFLDHSPGNTLIQVDDASAKFYLVDLNRMKFHDSMDIDTRVKNFAKLTPRKDMVAIMGDEYARLSGLNSTEVIAKMWAATQEFQHRFHRKKAIKKKIKFWKK
ncbi:MAG: Kdo domain containing protein [Cytophagaceae bacterium]|nr:Kdo domain containing protein [Cytophagaceae bacterium]|tara:strand:- start:334 stop:1098 length:765 start_codon:yes stop_codon:yes gene_type:complete